MSKEKTENPSETENFEVCDFPEKNVSITSHALEALEALEALDALDALDDLDIPESPERYEKSVESNKNVAENTKETENTQNEILNKNGKVGPYFDTEKYMENHPRPMIYFCFPCIEW